MGYKGVIFDLDGTLINSIYDIANSLNRVLKNHGLNESSIEVYTERIGKGLYQLTLDSIPQDSSDDLKAKIYKEFLLDYSQNYLVETKAYDNIVYMLKELAKHNIKLGVNSNKEDAFCKDIVNTLFKDIKFTSVIGDRKNINKKPDPYSANEIIKAMDLAKNEVVYVGDTDHDMATATNANIDSIGVSWGYRTLNELKVAGATHTVDSVLKLLDIIL